MQALQGFVVPCDDSTNPSASKVSSFSLEINSIRTQAATNSMKHDIVITTYNRFSLWEEEVDSSDCDDMKVEDVDSVRLFSDKIKNYECKEKGQHKLKVV